MIGYYVHHQGRGHAHRALALSHQLRQPVTGLSSLPPPPGWTGGWVRLERDDLSLSVCDATANGRLHWAPTGDHGLTTRAAQVSGWLDEQRPRLMVVDVSVEIALLARLHGVPVVTVVLPGRRADAAHLLGFDVSTQLVAMWPPEARNMLPGLPARVRDRVHTIGAVSRHVVGVGPRRPGRPRVLLMTGAGGEDLDDARIQDAQRQSPDWEWAVLGRHGRWVDDPRAALADADVVVSNAGQNSVAEIAAARKPAIVLPQVRPHEEQQTTAAALAEGGWPVHVEDRFPVDGWSARLESAARLDGERWSSWCDGGAATRFADLVAAPADDRLEAVP